ncbi:uncharacterized protein LOC125904284 isoform X3 [Epinephelus fuscoguttatus]|uniref:uncharacterized protein LOC125904284 isoform X3 n=1 Tax=Epinephelus fuscoguttatus TaxID=293821 RepID=UPI0020D0E100|nr:uncharacterized protein LOC125904284 isoform X3 [Epinephelus fuscoguttatus]
MSDNGNYWTLFSTLGFSYTEQDGSRGQQAKQNTSDVPLPSNAFRLLLGDSKAFPGKMRYVIPPVCSGSAPGPRTSGTCLKHLQREAPRRHPDQMPKPPQLTPLDVKEQRLYSKCPPDWDN